MLVILGDPGTLRLRSGAGNCRNQPEDCRIYSVIEWEKL